MNWNERDIIITDLETSGLIPYKHCILEVGALRVDAHTLEVKDEFTSKVNLVGEAEPKALEVNGYDERTWLNEASAIEFVLAKYDKFATDGVFASWNVSFDWPFLDLAYYLQGYEKTSMDYHRLDIMSIAACEFPSLSKMSLNTIAFHLGLEPEGNPHRAINGALKALEVLKKLRERRHSIRKDLKKIVTDLSTSPLLKLTQIDNLLITSDRK